MLTIRKIGFLVILAFLCHVPSEAQTHIGKSRFAFSITPLTGIIYGQVEEFLYKYTDSNQFVSQLIWDLKPLFYLGLKADFGPSNPFETSGFSALGSIKLGLPLKTGIMEDRDWNDDYADYLTHYSCHEAYIQKVDILADLSMGYSWRITDSLAFGTFFEFSYMYFSWLAKNGYYQYAEKVGGHYNEWDESIEKKPVYGTGIRYIQQYFIFSPGLSLSIKISGLFSLKGAFNYTPLIYCEDRDDHYMANMVFYGYFSFGRFINSESSFIFTPLKNLEFSFSMAFRSIAGLRDITYYAITVNEVPGPYIKNYEGGVKYTAIDLKLAARIRVFGRR